MKIRLNTLWRVPAFCLIAGWVSFEITTRCGAFFIVQTPGANGTAEISADPVRSTIFQGVLFLAVLLLGGLWFFRSMTKAEIAVSSAILSVIYFLITLLDPLLSSFSLSLTVIFAEVLNWFSALSSVLFTVTGSSHVSTIVTCFAPFLFVLFGKKRFDIE